MKRGGLSSVPFVVRLEDDEKRAWLGGLTYPEAQWCRKALKLGADLRLDEEGDIVFAPGSHVVIVAVP